MRASRFREEQIIGLLEEALPVPKGPNPHGSMDFMAGTLADGRTFGTLHSVDHGTGECVALEVGGSIPAGRVTRLLERLRLGRGLPQVRVMGNVALKRFPPRAKAAGLRPQPRAIREPAHLRACR